MAEINLNPDPRNIFSTTLYKGNREPGARRIKKEKPVFRSLFEKAEAAESPDSVEIIPKEDFDVAVETMLDAVHSEGDTLKDEPSFENIRRYKNAVRKFLSFVVRNSYDIKEAVSGSNILNRKKHTLVVLIDQKLEQLAAGLLQGQKEQLDLLRRLEEISGLLVDLMQ